jgi:hypothetical protein
MPTLMLEGQIVTPIVTRKIEFHLKGCKAIIKSPRRRYYNKINASKPMYPYSFQCYLGVIELHFRCSNTSKLKQKLKDLLQIKAIGRFHSEGMGVVQWIRGNIHPNDAPTRTKHTRKLRIRKGLPHNLTKNVKELLRYALLHDFVHNPKHKSKIYTEPNFVDLEYLRKHHDTTDDIFIQLFQKYDHLAAIITRKIRSPRTNRYNWSSNSNINFEKLATEIKEVASNIWKLYDYIHQSEELGQLNESLLHGHTSLRNHLLVIANLIVQDFQRNKL